MKQIMLPFQMFFMMIFLIFGMAIYLGDASVSGYIKLFYPLVFGMTIPYLVGSKWYSAFENKGE